MIEVSKDTRTVYTLTLGEDAMQVLLDSLAENPAGSKGADLYQEIGNVVLPEAPSVGDRIRILRDWAAYADVQQGDIYVVRRAPDAEGEFWTNTADGYSEDTGEFWAFQTQAEGADWERVRSTDG